MCSYEIRPDNTSCFDSDFSSQATSGRIGYAGWPGNETAIRFLRGLSSNEWRLHLHSGLSRVEKQNGPQTLSYHSEQAWQDTQARRKRQSFEGI